MQENTESPKPGLRGPFLPRLRERAAPDQEACRSLWVAVIEKAIKDMAYADEKRRKSRLTPSEREKLHRIYELEAPESFFESQWFEDICLHLELSPSRIRDAVRQRYLEGSGSLAL